MVFVCRLWVGRSATAARAWVLILCAALWLTQGAHAETHGPAVRLGTEGVEIRRTADGIPHVRAGSWQELGVGVGYAQAQDALCTLAEAFVTYEGRRAWFFGADERPARDSTFGRPKNIDLDFFFRAYADAEVVTRYRAQHPPELNELVEGFAAGYNRYLSEARAGQASAVGRSCLNQPWVRDIAADDVHRRMYAAQIAAGYAKFITEMANSTPAAAASAARAGEEGAAALRGRFVQRIGAQPGIGSNVLAFGSEATGGDGAVLFGNPHWYWGGPDRFYQMHLTIPGKVDVAGVAFLGLPMVMIGFNGQVAWSHTVSEARRFGLFDLTLDPADPTRYRVDGKTEAMTAREVAVEVRAEDGSARRLTRTFYRTRFGPVVDLGGLDAALGWGSTHALAIRDVNADNFRIFRNFFYWNQAKSLDDFIDIQRREAAVPWVNTVAIGRGDQGVDGRVWYADVGAVPNVPDELRQACATPLAAGFASVDPLTPVLDGSRSDCDWRLDPAAAQAGAMPVAAMPWLLRKDYVANMNDSYWLSNSRQPLEGYPALLGGERRPLGLRGRLGHRIALDLIQAQPGSAETLSMRLMRDVLTPRAYSAELFKDEVLAQACVRPEVELDADALAAAGAGGRRQGTLAPRTVDVGRACDILRGWQNKADGNDRGALLWEAFWARLEQIPAEKLYGVAFSSDAPLDTPGRLRAGQVAAAKALAATVLEFGDKGWPLDGALGTRRYVASGGRHYPIYGGCHSAGYFTVACNEDRSDRIGLDTLGNSYLQVVRFSPSGVQAHTLLAHGQDENAVADGQGSGPVVRYARKAWLHFPFQDKDIERDPALDRLRLFP
ncbi:penicillin amidase family protein 1 [Achromobacter xylosoxidans A8]|uniref:Penicillin amidase family protein 1 n=1 Tax=Achromobacter xylosoxidans (strain A8) TaxID=762376 RepID=E3HPU1_ACHXA|nr:penicillin acylase family protein [Achromobacter xylosoxidans]ADP15925.1 penicillin amidase family protein 1 [Achromobacter xylosoxidans A8]